LKKIRRDGKIVMMLPAEILFFIGLAMLGIIYYISFYSVAKKTLQEWRADRGMLFSLLSQNVLLLLAVGVTASVHRGFELETILLAAQTAFFVLTALLAHRADRLWPVPLSILLVFLHCLTFI
jgi:hypothetical protein